jgi:hypothetical protein
MIDKNILLYPNLSQNNISILNNFEYPINLNNFLNIVYNINNLNDLFEYINNNHKILLKETYIRLLNNSWYSLFDNIKNNFDLFLKINIFIFKDLMKKNNINDCLNDDIINDITNIIRKLIKKNKRKINYIQKIKEKLIMNFL